MRILFASSEVFPFSKTGGLGDVTAALTKALVKLGHEVLVVSPWYKELVSEVKPFWIGDISVPFDGSFYPMGVGELQSQGVKFAFVGHSDFQRDQIYGYSDDPYRFARFSRSIPQVTARVNFIPDIVHTNDWHTGYLPAILQFGDYLPLSLEKKPTVFTVHNAKYQGSANLAATLHWLRLPSDLRNSYFNHFEQASAMQAALGFAEQVTTVSPNYAQELMTPEYGYGLDGTFKHIAHKFIGILNGLDTEIWNTTNNNLLPAAYDSQNILGKSVAKQKLCEKFALDKQRPILSIVSRFVEQKGIDLFLQALGKLIEQDWNVVITGSGNSNLESAVNKAAEIYPSRVGVQIGYKESLAHLIYAGSDALAIPSRFEPCGLTQMIAMRYGTIPVARATGGLKDTIVHGKTGFLFEHPTVEGILWAAWAARKTYQADYWQRMILDCMAQDFSWQKSAKAYERVYEDVLASVTRS